MSMYLYPAASAKAEGENCSYGPTLFQVNGKLVHRHATAFKRKNFTNFGDKFFMNPDKISSQCSNVHRCLEPCTIQLKQTYFLRSPLGNFKVMQVSKKFAAFIAFKTKDKMFYVFYYLTFRKCTLKQHLAQREYLRGVHMIPLYSPTITFNYHMHAIITRS